MELFNLFVYLVAVSACLCSIYLVLILVFSKRKDMNKSELIKSCIDKHHINCGECKQKTCDAFAEDMINNKCNLSECKYIEQNKKTQIEEILYQKQKIDKMNVAYVFCRGGAHSETDFRYLGADSCKYMNKAYDGCKNCSVGCISCMDCSKVCPTNAIKKNEYGVAEVDTTRCIGCGECTLVCPNHIIKLLNIHTPIAVACNLSDNIKNDKINCTVKCTFCKQCINICPEKALSIVDGKIVCDKTKCTKCNKCVYACPTSAVNRQDLGGNLK